jgi:DNA-binding SARP family transcriptional activator
MAVLRVCLFGRYAVECAAGVQHDLEAGKVKELFCYLLLHHDRPHTREALATALWDDGTTGQSRKYLRQTLWQLQSALNASTPLLAPRLLSVEPVWVQLRLNDGVWVDAAEFETVHRQVCTKRVQALKHGDVQRVEAALQLYQGELLADCYRDWCFPARERLRNAHLALLDKMASYCEMHGDYGPGLLYADRILSHDPAHESTHCRVMRMHYLAGDRTAALRQFRRCLAALEQDLGVEPAPSTVRLYQQIRDARIEPADAPRAGGLPTEPVDRQLSHLLNRVHESRAILAQVERDLRHVLQARDLPDGEQ